MSWAETKKAVNSTVGTSNFKPLDKILEHYFALVSTSKPMEISSVAEMAVVLRTAEIGSVYKYVGAETALYKNGAYYIVEEAE